MTNLSPNFVAYLVITKCGDEFVTEFVTEFGDKFGAEFVTKNVWGPTSVNFDTFALENPINLSITVLTVMYTDMDAKMMKLRMLIKMMC